MKKVIRGVTVLLALSLLVALVGCDGGGSQTAKPSSQTPDRDHNTEQIQLLATVTHGTVMSMPSNWDADAEDDGIIVYPDLKDQRGSNFHSHFQ